MPQSVRSPRARPRSFTARLEVVVFAATLTSALALAWVSIQTLRAQIASDATADARRLVYVARAETRAFTLEAAREVERVGWLLASSADATEAAGRLATHAARVRDSRAIRGLRLSDREGRVLAVVGPSDASRDLLPAPRAPADELALRTVGDADHSEIVLSSAVPRGRHARPDLVLHARLHGGALANRLNDAVRDLPVSLDVVDDAGRTIVHAGTLPSDALAAARPLPTTAAELDVPGAQWRVVARVDEAAALAAQSALLRNSVAAQLAIVLVASLAAFFASSSLMQPIRQLSEAAGRLRDGEKDVPLPQPKRQDEVGVLTRTFSEMVARARDAQIQLELRQRALETSQAELIHRNAELHQANEVLEQLAITDGLTRIHNHRFFQEQLTREVKRADRTGAPLALLVIDLDDFKKLNDRHGHEVGDAVLQRVAEVLVEETRDHDLVARYGGEEFVVLAPDTDLAGAIALAEKLRAAIAARPIDVDGTEGEIRVTVSVGVSAYLGDRARLFREADRALYEAKHAGKDCVVVADESR